MKQDQEKENPVFQELLEARWGADLERIIRRHAPEYGELMYVARENSFQFEALRLETEASKESKHRLEDVPKYNNPVYGKTADLGRFFPDESIYVARRPESGGPEIVLKSGDVSERDALPAYFAYAEERRLKLAKDRQQQSVSSAPVVSKPVFAGAGSPLFVSNESTRRGSNPVTGELSAPSVGLLCLGPVRPKQFPEEIRVKPVPPSAPQGTGGRVNRFTGAVAASKGSSSSTISTALAPRGAGKTVPSKPSAPSGKERPPPRPPAGPVPEENKPQPAPFQFRT